MVAFSLFIVGVFLVSASLHAQQTDSFSIRESLKSGPESQFSISTNAVSKLRKKKRKKWVAGMHIVGYSGAMATLYGAWYKDYPQSKFHFYNDSKEWKGMDKLGHGFTAYGLSKGSMELWLWTGMSRKKSALIGSISGATFQTIIETLDGFSTEWGWSWADFAANVGGSSLLLVQELAWQQQRVQLKVSFHKKNYNDAILQNRSNELFGTSLPERLLKDYNGQTYWLSAGIKDFFPEANVPAWLQLSVGTGAEGMFGGYENIKKDDNGNIVFNRSDVKRYRQWYLAPDVNLSKIKTNSKYVRTLLHLLSFIKFPSPALQLRNGKLSLNWLAF